MLACLLVNFSLRKMHYVLLFNRIRKLNYYAKRGLEKLVFYSLSMTEKIEGKILMKRHKDFLKRKYIKNSLLDISKMELNKYFLRKIKMKEIR